MKLETGQPRSILDELKDAVEEEDLPLAKAARVVTSNVADILKLGGKGRVTVGGDADVVLLDREFRVYHMVANGKLMVRDAQMVEKGTFE